MSTFSQQISQLFLAKLLPVFGILFLAALALLAVGYLRGKGVLPEKKVAPYRRASALLTAREVVAYNALATAIPVGIHIVPQARFCDFIEAIQDGRRNRFSSAHMRIDRRKVDFGLFDANWKPLAAIELDDSTHQLSARSKRDQFEQEAFEAAGVPLIRIANSDAVEIEKVLAVLRDPSNA